MPLEIPGCPREPPCCAHAHWTKKVLLAKALPQRCTSLSRHCDDELPWIWSLLWSAGQSWCERSCCMRGMLRSILLLSWCERSCCMRGMLRSILLLSWCHAPARRHKPGAHPQSATVKPRLLSSDLNQPSVTLSSDLTCGPHLSCPRTSPVVHISLVLGPQLWSTSLLSSVALLSCLALLSVMVLWSEAMQGRACGARKGHARACMCKSVRTRECAHPRVCAPKSVRTQECAHPRVCVPKSVRAQERAHPGVWCPQSTPKSARTLSLVVPGDRPGHSRTIPACALSFATPERSRAPGARHAARLPGGHLRQRGQRGGRTRGAQAGQGCLGGVPRELGPLSVYMPRKRSGTP